jgi:hypothetical protein
MSSNIFGYQGVNTPLESLTNGRYNVADYTTLRETVNARLSVLEKDQAQPTNVVVSGSLTVAASNTQSGFITAAGNGSFGGNIIGSGNASIAGGLSVTGNAAINGLSGIVVAGPVIANGGVQFADLSLQSTALVPLIPSTYTNSTIVVNSAGVISSVSSGTSTNTNFFVSLINYDQSLGSINTPPASSFKNTEINLNFNNSCTVSLVNLTCEDAIAFPDGVRYVTITKTSVASGDYTVTVRCPNYGGPSGYNFYTISGQNVDSYSLNAGKYGVTFAIYKYASVQRRTVIKSLVN